jgi:NAD(P)-dependent dehydrogenase (short-subunit alcohol dehydrogenase family)
MARLQDKAALVTGSGRGIGAACAERFAAEGAAVMVADRDSETATATAEAINADGGRAKSMRADVSVPEECEAMVAETVAAFGRIDILVNNAGIGMHRLFLETTLEEWERVMRINLTGVFLMGQAAARRMIEQKSGRIINIGSISGQRGGTGRSAYGAAKAGVHQLTRIMAVELAPLGIAVNAIAPGPIRTDITNHGPKQTQAYIDRIPAGDYGTRDAIAAAALYLASDECTFVTGHTLNVDGGFNAAGLMFPLDEMHSYRSGPKD